eukprot:749879-Hanusia_phi.AAC.2
MLIAQNRSDVSTSQQAIVSSESCQGIELIFDSPPSPPPPLLLLPPSPVPHCAGDRKQAICCAGGEDELRDKINHLHLREDSESAAEQDMGTWVRSSDREEPAVNGKRFQK